MKQDLTLRQFLRLECKNRLSALPFNFSGSVNGTPVTYQAFRLEVSRFIVGRANRNLTPSSPPAKIGDLTSYLAGIITRESTTPSPF